MSRRVPFVAVLVALAGLVLASCDWAQPRFGPDRTGHNPRETVIGPDEVGQLTEAWSAPVTPASRRVEPLVARGRVFVVGNGDSGASSTLAAIDARDGSPLWTRTFEGAGTPEFFSPSVSIAVAGDTLVVGRVFGTTIGELSGLDPATGETRWSSPTGWGIADPVVRDGVIYGGYVDLLGGNVTGLAAFAAAGDDAGELLWRSLNWTVQRPRVALRGDHAYLSLGERLEVFDASGTEGCAGDQPICSPLWTASLGENRASQFPAVAGGTVYVAADDGLLRAFPEGGCGAAECPPLWTAEPGGRIHAPPAVAGGLVFVHTDAGTLAAYPAGGCRGAGPPGPPPTGAPPSCPPDWTGSTGGVGYGAPSVANGVVYVGGGDGQLRAFAAAGCAGRSQACPPLWSTPLGGPSDGSPAVAHGRVYAGAAGRLRAFALGAG